MATAGVLRAAQMALSVSPAMGRNLFGLFLTAKDAKLSAYDIEQAFRLYLKMAQNFDQDERLSA